MKVLITGGAGFLGIRLAKALLGRRELSAPDGSSQAIDTLVLFDQLIAQPTPADFDERVSWVTGDISDAATVRALVDRPDMSVFHLASVVSGGGEKDFDLAMRVNLDGGRHILEAVRAQTGQPRIVFTSSIAVFGGSAMPSVVGDITKQTPQTTYGITKSIGELLINDYTRKGFIDGRAARLPTVIIRPGKPNAAASGFVSAVFREPLNGDDYVLPVKTDTVMPVLGYRAIIAGLIGLHEADGETLGDDRSVSLPSLTVSVEEMMASLERVAGSRAVGKISVSPDPFVENICATWPQDAVYDRAIALGLPREQSLDEIVEYYICDYVDAD